MTKDVTETFFEVPDDALRVIEEEEEKGEPSNALISAPAQGLIWRSNYIMRLEGDLHALEAKYKPLIAEMETQLKHLEQRIEFQKRCIKMALIPGPDAEYVDDNVSLFYKTTTACDVFDAEAVPLEYCEVVSKPSTRQIKAVLEAGTEVPGARLVINYHLQVKPGGQKAKKNAESRRTRRIEKIVEA